MSTPIAPPAIGPGPTTAENRRIHRLLHLRHLMVAAGLEVSDWDRQLDDLTATVLAGAELRAAAADADGEHVAVHAALMAVNHHLSTLYREMLDDAIERLNPAAEVA